MLKAGFILWWVFLAISCEGCSGKKSTVEIPPQETPWPSRTNKPAARRDYREYMHDVSVKAYEEHGKHNPAWDSAARKLIASRVQGLFEKQDRKATDEMIAAAKIVEATGCDDPLARYVVVRMKESPENAAAGTTNRWVEVAQKLAASDYPLYWKFGSAMRAAQAAKAVAGRETPQIVHDLRSAATGHLIALVQDETMPGEVITDMVDPYINRVLEYAPNMRKWTYDRIEQALLANWGDLAIVHALKGKYYVSYAWDARGTGFADKVTDEGWKLFGERLRIARAALEKSWSLQPMLYTARSMMTVELGASTGPEGMELWFRRGMEFDPASYDLCNDKLNWLMPKWHGSEAEMISFGRECVESKIWRGNVPLILFEAHWQIGLMRDYNKLETKEAYQKRPEVWRDVKRSFERFFELNPENTGWRHDYARAAYRAEAWEDLRKQLLLLGKVNYEFFGGKAAYEAMVAKAEATRK